MADMNKRVTVLAQEAEQLSAEDRIRLVEQILATLHQPDPEIDRAWAEESRRRYDAYLRGEETARDAREALAEILKS